MTYETLISLYISVHCILLFKMCTRFILVYEHTSLIYIAKYIIQMYMLTYISFHYIECTYTFHFLSPLPKSLCRSKARCLTSAAPCLG